MLNDGERESADSKKPQNSAAPFCAHRGKEPALKVAEGRVWRWLLSARRIKTIPKHQLAGEIKRRNFNGSNGDSLEKIRRGSRSKFLRISEGCRSLRNEKSAPLTIRIRRIIRPVQSRLRVASSQRARQNISLNTMGYYFGLRTHPSENISPDSSRAFARDGTNCK